MSGMAACPPHCHTAYCGRYCVPEGLSLVNIIGICVTVALICTPLVVAFIREWRRHGA